MNAQPIITNPRTLRAMAKRGFIEWQDTLERHWTGHLIKRRWVRPGPALANWYDVFKFGRREYRLRYMDGCIHPFVTDLALQDRLPSFV